MRSRPPRVNPDLGRAVRRLRETPVPPAPPDLLERLVPPERTRPSRKPFARLLVAATVVAAVAALALLPSRSSLPVPAKSVAGKARLERPTLGPPPPGTPVAERPKAEPGRPELARRATTDGARPPGAIPLPLPPSFATKPPARADDLAFLNPGGKGLFPGMGGRATEALPPMRDDFVAPPDVAVAANGAPDEVRAWADEARARNEREAQVVDARLAKNVTLALKHASMTEVCDELARQTGVRIEAGRNVRDDNATIFVRSRPAREVMREIGRAFAFVWERDGEEGTYAYRLKQDAAAQVAEERSRNDDLARAVETLTRRVRARRDQSESKADLCREAFAGLLQDEGARLRSGQPVVLSTVNGPGRGELEPRIAVDLIARSGGIVAQPDGLSLTYDLNAVGAVPFSAMKDASADVTFRMRLTEFGGARLGALVTVRGSTAQGGLGLGDNVDLGEVRGAAEAPAANAKANAARRGEPGMAKPVALAPRPTTPLADQGADPGPLARNTIATMFAGYRTVESLKPPRPFMTSDDVWQAVHEKTGRDVVADSFSRLFGLRTFQGTAFDVLCQAGDALHQRWDEDGDWLVVRSQAYVWQRLNEVPKARLERWAKLRRARGDLPLESVLEMSLQTDRQLDAAEVGKTIAHAWGLWEWGIPSRPAWPLPNEPVRPICRFLANLPPDKLALAKRGALTLDMVPPADLERIEVDFVGADLALRVDYVPAGRYYWSPLFEPGKDAVHGDHTVGPTEEAVQREVHRRYPERPNDEVVRSDGTLTLVLVGRVPGPRTWGDDRIGIGRRAP